MAYRWPAPGLPATSRPVSSLVWQRSGRAPSLAEPPAVELAPGDPAVAAAPVVPPDPAPPADEVEEEPWLGVVVPAAEMPPLKEQAGERERPEDREQHQGSHRRSGKRVMPPR